MIKKTSVALIPPIIMLISVILLQGGKNILDGIYIGFPIIYIAQALLSKNVRWLSLGLFLTSAAFIVPINLLYNMGNCIELLIAYIILALISYIAKRLIIKKRKKRKNA